MTDEYSVIEPVAASVEFRGKAREISPLKVGQLPKFARAIKSVGGDGLNAVAAADIAGMFNLVADHGEAIIDAVAVASGIDRTEIEGAEIDDLVKLATAIVKVNADFFARRLTPALQAATAQAVTNGDGQTQ